MIQAITESQWRERVSTRETADKAVCSVLGELSSALEYKGTGVQGMIIVIVN